MPIRNWMNLNTNRSWPTQLISLRKLRDTFPQVHTYPRWHIRQTTSWHSQTICFWASQLFNSKWSANYNFIHWTCFSVRVVWFASSMIDAHAHAQLVVYRLRPDTNRMTWRDRVDLRSRVQTCTNCASSAAENCTSCANRACLWCVQMHIWTEWYITGVHVYALLQCINNEVNMFAQTSVCLNLYVDFTGYRFFTILTEFWYWMCISVCLSVRACVCVFVNVTITSEIECFEAMSYTKDTVFCFNIKPLFSLH
jgi:hypothetical protein